MSDVDSSHRDMPGAIEVVISGIAGRFPECDSTEEFKQKLYDNVDLLTTDNRRWVPGVYGAPARTGKLKEITKFDAEFFGVRSTLASSMDAQLRILLEVTHEAIVDAGINPQEIRGTKTGVYVGVTTNEALDYFERVPEKLNGYETIGAARSMLANRLSFQYDFKGPSVTVDTACSSTLFCLHNAIVAIKTGQCEAAIVAGTNLVLNPATSLMYHRYRMLSPTGTSRPFDIGANGYVRSEAVVAVYVRKSTDAKRIYATAVGTSTNADGFKVEGVTYPLQSAQSQLIRDTYASANLKFTDVHYIETHGTGTSVGDKQELNAISDVFCFDSRKSPLLVGSVKSNAGHTEPVSGLVSIAKVLYALETGVIPATINFETPNHNIPKLVTGELKVVDKQTPLPGDMISVNSFGAGGTNVHVILKANGKTAQRAPLPKLEIPRLVCLSGRTREALTEQFEILENHAGQDDLLTLINDIYEKPIPGYNLSGYSILGENPRNVEVAQGNKSGDKRPIYFIFPGMGSQSLDLIKDLLKFRVFKQLLDQAHEILLPHGFSVYDLFYKPNKDTFKSILNVMLTIIIVQIGLVNVLRSLGVAPDGIIGHSVGELACAYADGCSTLEQSLLTTYWRSRVLTSVEVPDGAMVAVGLSWEETRRRLPEGVTAACHNGDDSVTVSGLRDATLKFAETLKGEGVFAKPVDSMGYAFHSAYLAKFVPTLKPYYEKIMTDPKLRSHRWKSTSFPEDKWNTAEARYSSAEYHLNNIDSPVYFNSAMKHVPKNAITIEIAPHCLLQAILKRSLPPTVTNVALTRKTAANHANFLLEAIGKLYIAGAEPRLNSLYGQVEYPVVKGTPMISPMLRWDHSADYEVADFVEKRPGSDDNRIEVDIKTDQDKYLAGHTIDGRILYPAAGYILSVWKVFAKLQGKWFEDVPVVFRNLRFLKPTVLNTEGTVMFNVKILKESGEFELLDGETLTFSGNVGLLTKNIRENRIEHLSMVSENMDLSPDDFYKELRLRGYQFKDVFLGFVNANVEGSKGKVAWTGNWVSYIDTLFQFELFSHKSRVLRLPTYVREVTIDPIYHKKVIDESSNPKEVEVNHFGYAKTTQSGGVTVSKLIVSPVPSRKNAQLPPTLERQLFIPYTYATDELTRYEVLCALVGLFMENVGARRVKAAEIYKNDLLAPEIVKIIEAEVNFYVDYSVLSDGPVIDEQSELSALGVKVLDFDVTNAPLPKEHHLLVAKFTRFDNVLLCKISTALAPRGFVLLVENGSVAPPSTLRKSSSLQIVSVIENHKNKYFLLKKTSPQYEYTTLKIEDEGFAWVKTLQKQLADVRANENRKIVVYSDRTVNGVLGLSKCLVEEFAGEENPIRCVLTDSGEKYASKDFARQLECDLFFNVEKYGVWGSYRHLPIDVKAVSIVRTDHAKLSVLTKGDLSTLQWIRPSKYTSGEANDSIKISYVGINNVDLKAVSSMKTGFGVEFSGVRSNGEKVMGLIKTGALSSTLDGKNALVWDVPRYWTLEQSATVPYSFFAATYALLHKAKLSESKNVLVFVGGNSVNFAAVSVALSLECRVFVVAETDEQLDVIKTNYPGVSLVSTTCFNSKFVHAVLKQTQNYGVDYAVLSRNVPNRLPELLADDATIVITENADTSILSDASNGFSVVSAKFEDIRIANNHYADEIHSFIESQIKLDFIKPISFIVFPYSEVESAFRLYASYKSAYKIIVEVAGVSSKVNFEVYKRVYFDSSKSYIFSGGLGGFGMELTEWAVERGARNVILCSRSGIQTGYHKYREKIWRDQGVMVEISTCDLTTLAGAKETVKLALSMGPIGGIFNLAGVLRDGTFENQTAADFETVYNSKVLTTKCLDEASRGVTEDLEHFVTFSSISCGRGNRGQANYGYANSVVERISEQRQKQGLPSLSIQWGVVGDVGMAYRLIRGNGDGEIHGVSAQRMSSCLDALDTLLTQSAAVVASHVTPTKKKPTADSTSQSLTDVVAGIMGIQDRSSVKPASTLAELGMDSLMGVDIKQSIERGTGLSLTSTQIQHLKFSELEIVGTK